MKIIVEPIDLETELKEVPKIISELKAATCSTGAICKVGKTADAGSDEFKALPRSGASSNQVN
jgi:hypothetical protein